MAIKPLTLLNGTVADANEVEAIFLPLYIDMAPINVDVPNKLGTGRFVLESALTDAIAPVGTIAAFYDFNGVATFDNAIWNYCDGAVINSPGSVVNGQTLPDLSGRYIVGFGTIGGGDIDTAPFDATPVGNAASSLNLQHLHSVNAHSHTVNAHSHSITDEGLHEHFGQTDGMSTVANEVGNPNYRLKDESGTWVDAFTANVTIDVTATGNDNGEGSHDHVIAADGTHDHTGATGNASPGTSAAALNTNNALANATDIRPSSIRVRFIMKIN